MKFLAAENFPSTAFNSLRESGYNSKPIAYAMHSVADTDVIDFANRENRIILPFDGDFGTAPAATVARPGLIFTFGYRPPGVVYFRLENTRPDEPAHIVSNLLKKDYPIEDMVIESNNSRQRRIL